MRKIENIWITFMTADITHMFVNLFIPSINAVYLVICTQNLMFDNCRMWFNYKIIYSHIFAAAWISKGHHLMFWNSEILKKLSFRKIMKRWILNIFLKVTFLIPTDWTSIKKKHEVKKMMKKNLKKFKISKINRSEIM